jgi:predicted nucleic acid-binding protein
LSIVLDASFAIAWLFRTERTEAAQEVMRRIAVEGAMVPSLWRLEIANSLQNAVRRKRCDAGYMDRCLIRLARLPIETDPETETYAWTATTALARDRKLTLYDAAYLELAARIQKPLASCDAALIRAARDIGLDVLSA